MTWVVSGFGSWFILVIPFMRKKEQIWKRLNEDQEKAVDAWLFGMGIFIGLLVVSLFAWSWVFRERIHQSGYDLLESTGHSTAPADVPQARACGLWMKSVFVSWLGVLLPFLILMYRKADFIFKTAVERQTYSPKFRTVSVERSKRLLPAAIAQQLKGIPPTLRGGQVVTLVLKNGRKVSHVFVLDYQEILGIYDQKEYDFNPMNISDFEIIPLENLPAYEESKWLRLDGQS